LIFLELSAPSAEKASESPASIVVLKSPWALDLYFSCPFTEKTPVIPPSPTPSCAFKNAVTGLADPNPVPLAVAVTVPVWPGPVEAWYGSG
jgi:hypothetical protein